MTKVNDFQPLAIVTKSSILDFCKGPRYVSDILQFEKCSIILTSNLIFVFKNVNRF